MTEIAENCAIGIMLNHPEAVATVLTHLGPSDFTSQNVAIVEAISSLRVKDVHVDPVTVGQELERRGALSTCGGLARLQQMSGYSSLVALPAYVDELVTAKNLRRFSAFGMRLTQQAEAPGADPAALAALLVKAAETAADVTTHEDVHVPSLREFLDTPDPEYDWVIPGLLERSDRLVLTGAEGLGKSTLFRQLAVCIAAGVHPFNGSRIPAQRVLIVDCENGPTHIRRKIRPLAIQARVQGQGAEDTLFIEGRPQGLNLMDPRDQQWLIRRVQHLQPAVLFTGSLYKLFEDDPNKEQPARQVAATLDRCRVAGNCAVVVEAHSGHGTSGDAAERQVRPIGASMWLRWPEFGYGLRPVKDFDPQLNRRVMFVPWRGDRDEREWPKELVAGSVWPWQEGSTVKWGAA